MIIKYGFKDDNIDVTSICYDKLKSGNFIIIPKSAHDRAKYFTDPSKEKLKSIFIIKQKLKSIFVINETDINNQIEYDNTKTIYIDTTLNKVLTTDEIATSVDNGRLLFRDIQALTYRLQNSLVLHRFYEHNSELYNKLVHVQRGINDVIIYILCYSDKTFNIAIDIYSKYLWAKPIMIKYQDYTFENAFWKQLLEIKEEWINYEMVGTLSWKAYQKIDLNYVNKIIMNKEYAKNKYYNFLDKDILVLNDNSWKVHIHFKEIWLYILDKFNIPDFTTSYCNYWMCTVDKMIGFINWYKNICLPLLLEHPLILTDSGYHNELNEDNLIKLWNKPYYPHIPFILERLNKAYFIYDLNNTSTIDEKLLCIHNNLKIKYGIFNDELPEQKMVVRYLTGDEKILEIGGNIGRNSLVIASILKTKNNTNFVVLESDTNIFNQLNENKNLNNLGFNIENAALSKRTLIQKGWDTIASDVLLNGYKNVNTITYDQLIQKYNIEFDTLVLDCEGAFYYILMDMPEILKNINLIIMENDYKDVDHKIYIDNILKLNNFVVDYTESGGWGPCKNYFFEVWKKNLS